MPATCKRTQSNLSALFSSILLTTLCSITLVSIFTAAYCRLFYWNINFVNLAILRSKFYCMVDGNLLLRNIKVWKLVTYQRKDFSIIICLFIFLVLLLYYLCSIVGVNPKHNISEVFSWNLLIEQWCEPWYIWIIQTNNFLVQRTLHTKSGRILQIICVQRENWEVYGLNWTCLSFVWWSWGSVRKLSLILFWWVTLFHVFWDAPTFGFMIILSEFLTTLSQY